MSRRTSSLLIVPVLALIAGSAGAEVVAGRDYKLLRRAHANENPGKIEVIQFFSYGCPPCAEMHELVARWAAKLPADVAFIRIPVGFGRDSWKNLVKAYYALEASGALAKLDSSTGSVLPHGMRTPETMPSKQPVKPPSGSGATDAPSVCKARVFRPAYI